MADDSLAGRRRALRRAGFVSAGLLVVFDANRCRIELRRYRDAYGELPPEDGGR